MFCKKCGKELKDGTKFCSGCGTAVSEQAQNQNTTLQGEVYREPYVAPKKKKKDSKSLIIVLCVTVAVLVITLAVILIAGLTGKKGMELSVYDYPYETDNISYVLRGKASSYDKNAVLYINGEQITFVEKGERNLEWNKEVWLAKGQNTFSIVLETEDGNTKSETVEIEYKPELLYPQGTVLVKSDPAGIFIRPTPAITKEYILYVPYNDFSTQFVCQGEEYIDGDGFTWCRVQIPSGRRGWVRSDIVKSLY